MCGPLHLGRQTLFFLEKTGDLFSHHRLSAVSSALSPLFIFPEKLATFFCSSLSLLFISLVHSGVSPIISDMQNILPLLLWGPVFVGAPVRPNMLNMPKSAAVCVAVDPLEVTIHKLSMYHSIAVSFHSPLHFITVTTNYSVSTRAVL